MLSSNCSAYPSRLRPTETNARITPTMDSPPSTAAGDDQALLLEGGILGGLLLVRKTGGGVAVSGPLVVGEFDAGAQECRE